MRKRRTNKLYCNRCGNTLFFKRVINGCIAIPLEVEDFDDGDIKHIQETGRMEVITVHNEHYECGECGSQDIEQEEKGENDEYV